jgi:uncharacterized protein (DUF1800 family)
MHRSLCTTAFIACLLTQAKGDLDLDSNGLGDVWEAKFQPAAFVLAQDDDGDGRTNREEFEAGTDPLRADDVFAVRDITALGGNLVLKWSSQAGKRYQIQSTENPGIPGSWQTLAGQHAGNDGDLTVSTPRPTSGKAFFRVVAADIDSDGDGLTDWEEIQTGSNPQGGNDLAALTAALGSNSVVTITTVDDEATEPANAPAADPGSFRVQRSGGGIGRLVVNLAASGSANASDHNGLPTTVILPLSVNEVLVPLVPVPDLVTESDELAVLTVTPGTDYTPGSSTMAGVLIKDYVQPNGTGLRGEYWDHLNSTNNVPYFGGSTLAAPNLTRVDPQVNFDSAVALWPGVAPMTSAGKSEYFSARWTGEILPEYSQTYTIYTNGDESLRLKINGQVVVNNWPVVTELPQTPEDENWPNRMGQLVGKGSGTFTFEAGKRYPVVLEFYNNTGGHKAILSWISTSQSTEQVIPQTRLFPNTPPRFISPLEGLAFVGGPAFSQQISTSGSPTFFSAVNLPDGFSIHETTGVISGTPTVTGEWKAMLTATNAHGSGSAFYDLKVLQTGGNITREQWDAVPGTNVAQIPVAQAPSSTSLLTSLAPPANVGDDYGVRIRGFLTAPESGDYRFYLRADEAAAFYLSNDEEPLNSWKRAELTAPVASADWSAAAPTALLRLEAGERYYLEILHKESSGSDHLAIGWVTPSESTKTTPVITTVPGYVLTRYEDVTLGTWPVFTPPAPAPAWTSESGTSNTNANAAARFLQQATFGASPADISALQAMPSFEAWIDAELLKSATFHRPYVEQFRDVTNPNSPVYPETLSYNSWWKHSIQSDDQLRQRVAFALSQIMVVSGNVPLDDRADAVSDYYDMLLDNAFGNVRDLLENVTLHPAMGRYLDMLRNRKPSLTAGRIPNENYAREILQLFSLGLYRLNPDGSQMLNSKGELIPVYDQEAIIGHAHVFTGWDYFYTGGYRTTFAGSNWIEPMREVPAEHYTGRKRLLNNVVLPGIPVLNGVTLDPYGVHTGSTIANNLEFQALPSLELDAVHDQIFQHPNIGPFLCHQLIQRLVTSHPSPGYIYRVVSKFNDNGSGVRGDLKAVIKAILLDYEARSIVVANTEESFGKQREPVLRVTQLARAFRPANSFAGTYVQDGGLITVNTGSVVHRMSNNQKALLGFSAVEVPPAVPSVQSHDSGDYTVTTANPVPANTFTVHTRDAARCTWSIPASSAVMTVTTIVTNPRQSHGFATGQSAYLRFRTGGGAALIDGVYPVTVTSTTAFTVPVTPDPLARSGDIDAAWLRGSYNQTVSGTTATLTVTCGTLPGQVVGNKLTMSFTSSNTQSTPLNGVYTIATISSTEPRRFTLTYDSGPLLVLSRSGTFNAAPHTPLLNRSGNVTSGYSDWNLGNTDTVLGQTPLGAPTVFNFFEPTYKFPGELADAGLTTPEFQISSDTNVIRQANFLFGGIYSSSSNLTTGGYSNGFGSFRDGAHDIMMDLSPWMGPRTTGTNYWTNTVNLRDLIRELSKLLMAGQMSQAMEDQIYNHVSNTANVAYNATTPTDSERRNRIRGIVYFIAVSPEHAIQR